MWIDVILWICYSLDSMLRLIQIEATLFSVGDFVTLLLPGILRCLFIYLVLFRTSLDFGYMYTCVCGRPGCLPVTRPTGPAGPGGLGF